MALSLSQNPGSGLERYTENDSDTRPVDQEEYRASMGTIIQTFQEEYPQAQAEGNVANLAQTAFSEMLTLHVPSDDTSTHLQLALVLNRMISAQTQEEQTSAWSALLEVIQITQWL